MSISGAVKTISTLLRNKNSIRGFNAVINLTSNVTNSTHVVKEINEVIIIPSFNVPIVLIYDKKNGGYRLV